MADDPPTKDPPLPSLLPVQKSEDRREARSGRDRAPSKRSFFDAASERVSLFYWQAPAENTPVPAAAAWHALLYV
jgi:hypothetical protein